MRRLLTLVLLPSLLAFAAVLTPTSSDATERHAPTVAKQVTTSVSSTKILRLPEGAQYVAAYWRGNPQTRVTLAFSHDGTHFDAPLDAARDEVGLQRRNGTTYGAIHAARGALAVRVVTDRPLATVTILGMSDGAVTTQGTMAGQAAQAATTQPQVVSRAGWGADPQYMTWAPAFYLTKKLIVHHTDTTNDYVDQAGAESQIRSIYYYHSVTQGWGDIGYNFLIDKFGNVYEGRYSRDYGGANPSGDDASGKGVTGAHTLGWNSGTVGIALLGTFTGQDVTPAARQALESMLAWEASRNGINPQATEPFVNPVSGATITSANIAGHRDYNATACPGDTFYLTLPTIRADVAARITGSSPDTTPPTTPGSLLATGGKGRVSLNWAPSTDNTAVTGYQIWRSQSASKGFTQVATVKDTSYVDGSLARRTTYYYKARAYDAAANLSAFSNLAWARTS